jgi:hypothetical protein
MLFAASLGLFTGQTDVGPVSHPGLATFDPSARTYTITGAGNNMWFGRDEFHYVWKKLDGNFLIEARMQFEGRSAQGHRKALLMIRKNLEMDSAYADAAVHGDGLVSLQFRTAAGETTHEVQTTATGPGRFGLERIGGTIYLLAVGPGGRLESAGSSVAINLGDSVYVGLGVCAHDPTAIETVTFSEVSIERPDSRVLSVRSSLEYVKIPSGDRRSVYHSIDNLSNPQWSADGSELIYKDDDKSSQNRLPLGVDASRVPSVAGPVQAWVYFSSDRTGKSQIWRRHGDRTGEEPVTHDEFNSYFPHPSPDGKWLVMLTYGSGPVYFPGNQNVTLRLLPINGDRPVVEKIRNLVEMYGGAGSIGLPSWAPDSSKLAYVRYQPQVMFERNHGR